MRSLIAAVALTLAGVALTGCQATAPRELLDARNAYREARSSDAPSAELQVAGAALAEAERSHAADGDEPHVRDLAYVAQRKAELALVRASLARAVRVKQLADRDLGGRSNALATPASGPLDPDRAARITGRAVFRLTTGAGGAGFADADERTLATALDALLHDPSATIVVEGHTDDAGDESWNVRLSEHRAREVRDRLIALGAPAERVRARGAGGSQPIADNAQAAGRATNRRVEITVLRP